MYRKLTPLALLCALACVTSLTACDTQDDTIDGVDAALEAEFDPGMWDAVPLPEGAELGFEAQGQSQTPAQLPPPWKLETFTLSSSQDFLALTSAPGGLFAPYPADIPTLPAEIADGLLVAGTFRNQNGEVIGFGTEQEVLDFPNLQTATTYTITIPGRGTLMLEQLEDISWLVAEVNDMVASQEFVRAYDPPVVLVNSIEGTGRVIGGTGEFSGAKGSVREIGTLHELNLITLQHDLDVDVQVLFFDPDPH